MNWGVYKTLLSGIFSLNANSAGIKEEVTDVYLERTSVTLIKIIYSAISNSSASESTIMKYSFTLESSFHSPAFSS